METVTVPASLRNKIGYDASEGLLEMFAAYHQFATDRYERRLAEETARVRVDIANLRADLMKWTFLLWVGQFAALSAVFSYIVRR